MTDHCSRCGTSVLLRYVQRANAQCRVSPLVDSRLCSDREKPHVHIACKVCSYEWVEEL